jgi:hypothetical protein
MESFISYKKTSKRSFLGKLKRHVCIHYQTIGKKSFTQEKGKKVSMDKYEGRTLSRGNSPNKKHQKIGLVPELPVALF